MPKYRVCGYRYRHKSSTSWSLCTNLPNWVKKLEPTNKSWVIERLYYRLEGWQNN